MNIVTEVISWMLIVALGAVLLGCLLSADWVSSVFIFLSMGILLPIKKWSEFKKSKFRCGFFLSTIMSVVFFITGIMFASPSTTNTSQNKNKNIDVDNTVVTTITSETGFTSSTTTITTSEAIQTRVSTATLPTSSAVISTSVSNKVSENSTFTIKFIDVGQADAALVECDGHYMLIDGGNVADSSRVYSVLESAKVSELDIIVGTHAHEDHIGGLAGALNYTTADLVLCPVTEYDSDAFRNFKTYAERNGNGIKVPEVNDTYRLGSSEVKVIGVNGGTDTNDTSIVLKVEYGDTSFLFTGDASRPAEQTILNSNFDLSSTVLKVGHHGSDESTSYNWLNEIMPKYAIISVGEGNSYGHPTDAVLSRLRDADVTTYRTDLNGDILVVSDGKTVTITADKSATDEEVFKAGSNVKETEPPVIVTEPEVQVEQESPQENIDDTPAASSYVVNTNTGKFHSPFCSSVKTIKDSNRWDYTGTRDELISNGYEPCKKCKP